MLLAEAGSHHAWSAHQVAFVEQQQQVLVPRILPQMLLQVAAPRALRVPRVQYLPTQQIECSAECMSLPGSATCIRYSNDNQTTGTHSRGQYREGQPRVEETIAA